MKTQKDTRHEKSSLYRKHAFNPSGTNSPPQIKKKKKEDDHNVCHSIPTLWSMIWSQRSYVLADSQSIFRAEATDRRSQREGETLLVCVLSFLFFKRNTIIHHASSLRAPPRDVYQRKWIFKALPAHKNDWEHVRKHKSLATVSGHFRGCQYALKDGVLFQPIIARCMKAFSEPAGD